MEQVYDRALKALMEDHAAEMLPELLPGAELVSIENVEINRSNLRADLVYFIKYRGEPRVLNLELQTDRDGKMNYRMLQYYVELLGRYEMPIISMVMYPFETNVPEPILQQESGTGTSLSFQHQIITTVVRGCRTMFTQRSCKYVYIVACYERCYGGNVISSNN